MYRAAIFSALDQLNDRDLSELWQFYETRFNLKNYLPCLGAQDIAASLRRMAKEYRDHADSLQSVADSLAAMCSSVPTKNPDAVTLGLLSGAKRREFPCKSWSLSSAEVLRLCPQSKAFVAKDVHDIVRTGRRIDISVWQVGIVLRRLFKLGKLERIGPAGTPYRPPIYRVPTVPSTT